MREPDVYLATEAGLTPEQREQLLELAFREAPRLRGAHVADVLDIFDDHDYCLHWTEPFYEQHPIVWPEDAEAPGPDKAKIRGVAVLTAAILAQAVPEWSAVEAIIRSTVGVLAARAA
jgi:hypothetical protein